MSEGRSACAAAPRALSGISRPLSLRLVLTTTSGQPALRTTVFSCCVSHGRHLAAVRGTRQPARGSARVSGFPEPPQPASPFSFTAIPALWQAGLLLTFYFFISLHLQLPSPELPLSFIQGFTAPPPGPMPISHLLSIASGPHIQMCRWSRSNPLFSR